MASPSFERIDYSIRTNKNIERKLVFERLLKMKSFLDLSSYRYLGLGSIWFPDFVLAHRILGITDLWSVERESPNRAEYNRPYGCIDIRPGASSDVLDGMTREQWAKPSVVWFDYDGIFDLDVRADCHKLLERLSVWSLILVSVNASRRSYKSPGLADETGKVIERLRDLFADAVPANALDGGAADVSNERFPDVLGSAILNLMTHVVRTSGRGTGGTPDRFVPLFQLRHRDGAEMTTVGGMIVASHRIRQLEKSLGFQAEAAPTQPPR